MLSDTSYLLALGIMTVAAFGTRIAGAVLMSRVTPTTKTERFLEGLSVSVIAALVASHLVTADIKTIAAVVVAMIVMGLARSAVWAMLAGMLVAASYPYVVAIARMPTSPLGG